MKANVIYVLFGLCLGGLSGCAVTDFDRSADFAKYQTFAWGKSDVNVSNPLYRSEFISKKIRETVEEEFAKRGIVRSDNNPDLTVRYHTFTDEKKRITGAYPYSYRFYPYGFYPFGYGWYPYSWMTPRNTTEYTEGTLILDIFDNRSNELVWRGSVSGDVDDVSRLKKQIEKGVKAIIKKYPVTPEPEGPLDIDGDENLVS